MPSKISNVIFSGKGDFFCFNVWDDQNLVHLCRSQFVGAVEGAVGDGGWCGDKETARKHSSFRLAAKEKQSTVPFTI